MTTVTIRRATTHLPALGAGGKRRGRGVALRRRGQVVTEIVPPSRGSRQEVDRVLGKVRIKGDPAEPTQKEWEHA